MSEPNVAGFVVRCRGCGGRFHKLTDKFRSVPPMRGSYLKLLPRWQGWYAFPERDWVVGDNVQCPQCGTPYTVASILKQLEVHNAQTVPDAEGGPADTEADSQGVAQPDALEDVQAEEVDPRIDDSADDDDDAGIYADLDGCGDVVATVMRMTREGESQARIAETCQMSIYAVRKIQNGKKV